MLFSDDHVCELVVRVTEIEVRAIAAGQMPALVRQAVTEAAKEGLANLGRAGKLDLPLFAHLAHHTAEEADTAC